MKKERNQEHMKITTKWKKTNRILYDDEFVFFIFLVSFFLSCGFSRFPAWFLRFFAFILDYSRGFVRKQQFYIYTKASPIILLSYMIILEWSRLFFACSKFWRSQIPDGIYMMNDAIFCYRVREYDLHLIT